MYQVLEQSPAEKEIRMALGAITRCCDDVIRGDSPKAKANYIKGHVERIYEKLLEMSSYRTSPFRDS